MQDNDATASKTQPAAAPRAANTGDRTGQRPADDHALYERIEMRDALYKRFGTMTGGDSLLRSFRRARYLRKKYAWITLVGGAKLLKRSLDMLAALYLLAVLSPLFLIVGFLIKATDRGPLLFWQTRVGQLGREFPFPKFRSMVVDAEKLKEKLLEQNDHVNSLTFKMRRDPRVTWIGRIIRRLSIDEIPQLWCVLKGDMSLVGPRPPLPSEVVEYTLADRRRLDVVPGLTCFWQVKGRGDIPFDQQVELDVEYIRSRSFWVDIKILFATVPAVLFGKGAY